MFQAINGTYNYTVATMNKDFVPVTTASNFTVAGKPVNVSVTFKPIHNYTDDYIIAGVIAAIAVIGLSVFVLNRKKALAKQK
jgi:hypothetical protein